MTFGTLKTQKVRERADVARTYMPEDTERRLAWLFFPFFRGTAIGVPHNDVAL